METRSAFFPQFSQAQLSERSRISTGNSKMNRWSQTHYWTYSIPLSQTLQVPPFTLSHRKGLLMQWKDSQGTTGWGEICPLPGLHKEAFDEAWHQVLRLKQVWADVRVDEHFPLTMERWTWLGDQWDLWPSVRFGLDMTLLTYWMQRKQTSLAGLLGRTAPQALSMQALLTSPLDSLLKDAEERWERGYRAFKVKVGRLSLQEDIQRIRALHQRFHGEALLRLDANRRWSLEEAVYFAQALEGLPVDYFEEPLLRPEELPAFRQMTGYEYALDESLWELTPRSTDDHLALASALVLKPNILGGWRATQQWVEWAETRQRPVVFSSSFESGVGLAFLAQWAAALETTTPVGLDTANWLVEPLLTDWQQGGQVPIPVPPAVPSFDHELLQPLD
jgi:O-succinylbenzoate synthase